jgi:hypothetical protein
LAVSQHLVSRGHGRRAYREPVQGAGGSDRRAVVHSARRSTSIINLDGRFPNAARSHLAAQLCFGLKHIFADAIPHQSAGIRDIRREFPVDAIIADTMFCGTFPLLLGPREKRVPVVALGITALALSSADTAFFGTALPPALTPQDRARNVAMNSHLQQAIFGDVQRYFNDILVKHGSRHLPAFLFDSMITLPDLYLQLTARPFEYPRGDMPDSIRRWTAAVAAIHRFPPAALVGRRRQSRFGRARHRALSQTTILGGLSGRL